MTQENGAKAGDEKIVNSEVETKEGQDGGAEGANVEAEKLKQELATRDKKIAELLEAEKRLKEIESQREADKLAQKTTEEKLEHYQKELEGMRREQTLSRKLAELGVSVEEANKVLSADSVEEQADALTSLLRGYSEKQATKAVEELKGKMLDGAQKSAPDSSSDNDDSMLDRMKQVASQI